MAWLTSYIGGLGENISWWVPLGLICRDLVFEPNGCQFSSQSDQCGLVAASSPPGHCRSALEQGTTTAPRALYNSCPLLLVLGWVKCRGPISLCVLYWICMCDKIKRVSSSNSSSQPIYFCSVYSFSMLGFKCISGIWNIGAKTENSKGFKIMLLIHGPSSGQLVIQPWVIWYGRGTIEWEEYNYLLLNL